MHSRRKIACNACRRRKKTCSGTRPSCDLCKSVGRLCEYSSPASASRHCPRDTINRVNGPWTAPTAASSSDFFPLQSMPPPPVADQWPPAPQLSDHDAPPLIPTDEALNNALIQTGFGNQAFFDRNNALVQIGFGDQAFSANTNWPPPFSTNWISEPTCLPPRSQTIELVDIFFTHFHVFVPCLHEASFRGFACMQEFPGDPPALVYAVLAIAAHMHPDPSVRQRQDEWSAKAKAIYADCSKGQARSVQLIQAAACIIFHAMVTGDIQTVWFTIGDAWKQACAMDLNRIDAADQPDLHTREKEECRRAMWSIFLLDRGASFPCGLPYAIDDRQFLVNLPIHDYFFGGIGPLSPEAAQSVPFTRILSSLIASKPLQDRPSPIMHHLIKAYVIMGRIVEHVYSLHPVSEADQSDRELNDLDSTLIHFRLSLPRSATNISDASPHDFKYIVWFGEILHSNTILLHYRRAASSSERTPNNSSGSSSSSDSNKNTPLPEDPGFYKCVAAARGIIKLIKDASRIATDTLINPHISPALYLCSRILLIQWYRSDDDSLRNDIELLSLIFDRMSETFPLLGPKFNTLIWNDLQLNREGVQEMRDFGSRELLTQCSSWRRR